MEFVIYLQLIINSDVIYNLFAINYQFRWNLLFICNQLLIPMEFVIYFQLIINSDEICNWFIIDLQSIMNSDETCNWFAINYEFRWNL